MEREYRLKISGLECRVLSAEPEEKIRDIANDIEARINEITSQNERVSVSLAAIIAAMGIYEDLYEERKVSDNLRAQIKSYSDDASKAIADKEDAFTEIDRLRREIDSLRNRLAQNR